MNHVSLFAQLICMIQRIQSVYLLLVLLLSVALFFVDIYSVEATNVANTSGLTGLQQFSLFSNGIFVLLNSLTGLFALAIIFLYKNRNLQIRLSNLAMLITCVFIGTIFYFADHAKTNVESIVHYSAGCYFPLIQLVFTFLAMRAIKKDELLVRSADRLR